MSAPIRLQRFLSQAGVASRRKAETLITDGHVHVNGRRVTTLGTKVDPRQDRVEVHGKRVRAEDLTYLLLHKPAGVVTTLDDPEGRPTIVDLLPRDGSRIFPVGRLDFYSEGALLCTNDGELAHALTHPSRRVPKRYLVRVRGTVSEEQLAAIGNGVDLEDGRSSKAKVLVRAETRSHTWLDITVHEGRNRLIRRMCDALDLTVMRLLRSEFAGLTVDDLHPGTYRPLSAKEIAKLRATAGLERKTIRNRRERDAGPQGGHPRGRSGSPARGRRAGGPGGRRAGGPGRKPTPRRRKR
jgi:23S rRNA pseudouridine2605 synthase